MCIKSGGLPPPRRPSSFCGASARRAAAASESPSILRASWAREPRAARSGGREPPRMRRGIWPAKGGGLSARGRPRAAHRCPSDRTRVCLQPWYTPGPGIPLTREARAAGVAGYIPGSRVHPRTCGRRGEWGGVVLAICGWVWFDLGRRGGRSIEDCLSHSLQVLQALSHTRRASGSHPTH